MAQEPRKVFVGGIPRSGVKSDDLKAHFTRYGEVVHAVVMMNPETGLCRGFGFVEFADEAAARKALDGKEKENHVFNNHRVEVKRAKTRHVQTQTINPNAGSKKIFVGGLRENVAEDDLMVFFEKFGSINDVVVMYERMTRRPRGFGFVTFDSHEAAAKVLENRFHDLNGIKVETKLAEPRQHNRYQHGYYHEPRNDGYRSPANNYVEMWSPHYLFHDGSNWIAAYPYPYTSQGPYNHGYMMNHATTSNDTSMMVVQRSPMYAYYGSASHNGIASEQ